MPLRRGKELLSPNPLLSGAIGADSVNVFLSSCTRDCESGGLGGLYRRFLTLSVFDGGLLVNASSALL